VSENRQTEMMERSLSFEEIGGFDSKVSQGSIDGFKTIHKFGGGICGIAERTVWDNMAAADYPYKYTNTPMTVVSSSASDTGQTITVLYITLVGSDWVYGYGVAVTNGLTPVTIQNATSEYVSLGENASIMFPYRASNRGTGQGTGSMVGNLSIANGGTTYAQIRAGINQTLMAIFPIASGYSVFTHSIGRSVVGSNKFATFTYSAIPFGQCRQARRVVGLSSDSDFETFDLPYFFGEKTILEVRSKMDTGTAEVNGWFDLFLVENRVL